MTNYNTRNNNKRNIRASRKNPSKRVELESIGKALGASHSFKVATQPHAPFALAALAHEVEERLVSNGGRPSDAAPTVRRLVPIRRQVWEDLRRRASRLSAHGRCVSPAQLAAILLEKGLAELERSNDGTHAG